MSFYANLQINNLGEDSIDIYLLKESIIEILSTDGIHEDVFEDLQTAFDEGEAPLNVTAAYLKELITKIATLDSNYHFEARAIGEEFRDLWVAEFDQGSVIFSAGTWGY